MPTRNERDFENFLPFLRASMCLCKTYVTVDALTDREEFSLYAGADLHIFTIPMLDLLSAITEVEPYRNQNFESYVPLLADGELRCMANVALDPLTNEEEFTLYTDDGKGNGNHIVTILLSDLKTAVEMMP